MHFSRPTRRSFLKQLGFAGITITIPAATIRRLLTTQPPVRLGLIADLHQDIMHDGMERMQVFSRKMSDLQPDALVQLGDFAYPSPENKPVIDLFNGTHPNSYHVIGNHDTDAGFTKEQCLETWGMPSPYYSVEINGLRLLVLDGNEEGSPDYSGGYVSYIGPEQQEWLQGELQASEQPVIIASHQPMAGTAAIDNAKEIQALLSKYQDKILLAINGHSHIDDVIEIDGVAYIHINSASYFWMGEAYKHASYPAEIHEQYPWIAYTCPYQDCLFSLLTIDPAMQKIHIEGRQSRWVGSSPSDLGLDRYPELTLEKEIAPQITEKWFTW